MAGSLACQSRPLRASREASKHNTAPTSPGTEPCHQPLEAGPRHHPAGGAAKVVIDHLDLAETPAPRDIDELVLAPLALEVGLDLGLGGLPNIDHRLALQHRGGQEISARHRHAPPPRRRRPPTGGGPAGRAPCRASEGLIPRSLPESNGMLSWRGAADGSGGVGRLLILLLLDDGRIVQGASSETTLDQQVMQLIQRRYRHARRAERHSGAGGGIQHPRAATMTTPGATST